MLQTKSLFLYGIKIEAGQSSIAFVESDDIMKIAAISPKAYTLQSIANALSSALNLSGNQSYTVEANINSRSLTISSDDEFSILINTSPFAGSSIHQVLGLGFNDLTGQDTYATSALGILYKPQFFLLDYVSGEDNQQAVDSTINETSGGEVEVVRYGIKKIYELTIDFVTNEPQDNWIDNDQMSVDKLRLFLEYIVQKGVVEFFPDRDDLNSSVPLVLETTPESRNGVSFKIKEKPGFPNYFTTGLLTFRKVDL